MLQDAADQKHWAVCRVLSQRLPIARREIEKIGVGTFVPTYVRTWGDQGKHSARERPLMPGYLFFLTTGDDWGAVAAADGVIDVIAHEDRPCLVSAADMRRLVLEDDRGFHIIRVVEREEFTRKPFTETQVEIKKKIKEKRTSEGMREYLEKLKKKTPVWTIVDDIKLQGDQPPQ